MSTLPRPKKDSDGFIDLGKMQPMPAPTSQEQADAQSLYSKAYDIDPTKAAQIAANAKEHPELSAGVAVSMGLNNVLPNNPVAKNLAYINQIYSENKLKAEREKAQAAEDAAFQRTPWGAMWQGIKAASRAITTVAFSPQEYMYGLWRGQLGEIYKHFPAAAKYAGVSQIGDTNFFKNFSDAGGQTVLSQAIYSAIKTGKLDLGSGFFADHTSGAGFLARQEQAKMLGSNIYDPKNPSKVIGVRPYEMFNDPVARIVSNGHPDGVVGTIAGQLAELAASFATDPTILVGKAAKAAELLKTQQTVAAGVEEAAAWNQRAERLAAARAESEKLAKELKDKQTKLSNIDISRAEVASERARKIWQARSTDAIESQIALRTGDTRVSQWYEARTQLAARKEVVAKAEETYKNLRERFEGISEEGKPTLNEVRDARDALKSARQDLRKVNVDFKAKGETYRDALKNAQIAARARDIAAQDFIKSEKARLKISQKIEQGTATRDEVLTNYANTLEKEAGLKDAFNQNALDYNALNEYLTLGSGRSVLNNLANVDDWKDVWKLFKNKIPLDACVAIADAKTAEQVAMVLSRYIKTAEIAPGILRNAEDTIPAVRFIKGAQAWGDKNNDLIVKIGSHFMDSMNNTNIGKGFVNLSKAGTEWGLEKGRNLKRAWSTFMPRGGFVDIRDTETLLRTVENYGNALRLPEETINKLLDEVAYAPSDQERGYAASAKLFNAIYEYHSKTMAPELAAKFKELTTLFQSEKDSYTSYWANRHVHGTDIEFIDSTNGRKLVLSGPQLDTELLNSRVYLPAPKQLLRMASRFGKYKAADVTTDLLDNMVSGFWKKTVLVRPAFVLRNIAEEQLRVFGVGHIGFFNHPIAALAMWMGRPSGSGLRTLMNSFNKYRNTAFGKDWKTMSEEDLLADEIIARQFAKGYIDVVSSETRGAYAEDDKMRRILIQKGVGSVAKNHPRFYTGVANEVRRLNASEIVRVVAGQTPKYVADAVSKGATREDAVVDYFLNGPGKAAYSKLARSKRLEVRDWLLSPDGAKQYLYTGTDSNGLANSVFQTIKEASSDDEFIKKLIAYGKVSLPNGRSLTVPTAKDDAEAAMAAKSAGVKRKKIIGATELFGQGIEENFNHLSWTNTLFNVPVKIAKADARRELGFLRRAVDSFFEKATEFEKTTTMGPEYTQAYWDSINKVALSLNADAKAILEQTAKKSLNKIEDAFGKPIGRNHPVWSAFEKAGKGPLTLEDAHAYADNAARMHVKDLFYDAHNERMLFHALRLIFPFGNAWADTLHKWTELGVKNPLQIYKGSKLMNWLESPESSAIYNITDAKDYYDPTQGFFYKDPSSGERMFWVPFAGTILTKMVHGLDAQGSPIAFKASPMSFNFALGTGSILPSFGPVLTLPVNVLGTFGGNKTFIDNMPPAIRDWLFPFGPSDFSSGILGAIVPANWNRILGGLAGQEETYASLFKPTMAYLSSSGSYSETPEDQARLVRDTDFFARWFGVMRGVIGLVSPMSLTPENMGKDQNGDATTQLALYNDFQGILNQNNGDYNTSLADFMDLYGPEAVYAIINNYKGQGPSNSGTEQLLKQFPDIADKYPDTFGFIMPGGNFSINLRKWNLMTGRQKVMSSQDIKDKATELLYNAAKDRIIARAQAEGWSKETLSAANNSLADRFGGGPKTEYDVNHQARVLKQFQQIAYDKRFADLPTMQSLRDYLYYRDAAVQASGRSDLKSKSASAQREWLADRAVELVKSDPSFSLIFNYFFSKELEG